MKMHRATMTGLAAVIVATGLAPAAHAGGTVAAAPAPIHSITYQTWFSESFDRGPSGYGQWDTGPYRNRLSVYDGFTERNVGPVVFEKDTVTVQDGRLVMFGYRQQLADGSWRPVGAGVVPLLGGKYVGFRYGRFSFDLEAAPGPAGMSGWWFAGLLWPQSNRHCDGEIDWPEMVPGGAATVFHHLTGTRGPGGACSVNPQDTCLAKSDPSWATTGEHRYRITWLPTGVTYERDGVVVAQTNCAVPNVPMQLKLQLVSLNKPIEPDQFGHVYIDDIQVEKAYYQQG